MKDVAQKGTVERPSDVIGGDDANSYFPFPCQLR
jgi:hypothetical protein